MEPDKRKVTVLYIDDSAVEREVVCHLLTVEGCEVMATGNPEAGIELARERVPDLILLDLHMPGMDGRAVVERLRTIPALQGVPVVALSASIKEEERANVYASFDGFLKKPVDAEVFPREVRAFISRGREDTVASGDGKEGGGIPSAAIPEDVLEALETLEKIRATMSHDLRSPLTVMISYASTVGKGKAGNLSERQKEMLDLVVEKGFEMDELIAELVRIARKTLERYGYL